MGIGSGTPVKVCSSAPDKRLKIKTAGGKIWIQNLSEDALVWGQKVDDQFSFTSEGEGAVLIDEKEIRIWESLWRDEGSGPLKLLSEKKLTCDPICKIQEVKKYKNRNHSDRHLF